MRAVLVRDDRLLLVNAWPAGRSDLLCAPGGGVKRGSSLPDNLAREVHEETGLRVEVGSPCLINEFHDPRSGFHQVEVFFRCWIDGPADVPLGWKDAGRVVSEHHWLTAEEIVARRVKPDALAQIAFAENAVVSYDPLERILF